MIRIAIRFAISVGIVIALSALVFAQGRVSTGDGSAQTAALSYQLAATEIHPTSAAGGIDDEVDQLMQVWRVKALTAAVVRENAISWYRPYGNCSEQSGNRVGPPSVFVLGEISETVIATALLQLMEKGRFHLDDPINPHLEEPIHHPHSSTLITFRMLLTHTAGLSDDGILGGPAEGDPMESIHEIVWGYFLPRGEYYDPDRNFSRKPGEAYEHSSMGMVLAARLVEEISGQDLETYCKKNIFDPLGMTNTSWYYRNLDTSQVVHRYQDGTSRDLGLFHHKGWWAATDLKSTLPSMTRFLRAILQSGELGPARILDIETVDEMLYPYVAVNATNSMGLGWMQWTSPGGEKLWYRYGSRQGVRNDITISSDMTGGVVFLSNANVDAMYTLDDYLYFEARKWEPYKISLPSIIRFEACEASVGTDATCVSLFNLSGSPVRIEGIIPEGTTHAYSVNDGGCMPLEFCEEFECYSFEVMFAPTASGVHEDRLIVFTNGEGDASEISIPMTGESIKIGLPEATFYASSNWLFRMDNPEFELTSVAPFATGRIFRGLTIGPPNSMHENELLGVAPKIGYPAVSEVWRICCASAKGLKIAELEIPQLLGIAYLPAPAGEDPSQACIYAVTPAPSTGGQLYAINPATGVARLVREYPSGRFCGLTQGPDGYLWASGRTVRGSDVIYKIDPGSGDTTFVGHTGLGKMIKSLAWGDDPQDLFGLQTEGVDPPSIVWISSQTGAATFVRSVDVSGLQAIARSSFVTGIAEEPSAIIPGSFVLHQNHPNPFNPTTTIRYDLPRSGHVTLKVYSLLGQEVATLVDEVQEPGACSVEFVASGLASGIYLYRLSVEGYVQTRKMALVR